MYIFTIEIKPDLNCKECNGYGLCSQQLPGPGPDGIVTDTFYCECVTNQVHQRIVEEYRNEELTEDEMRELCSRCEIEIVFNEEDICQQCSYLEKDCKCENS